MIHEQLQSLVRIPSITGHEVKLAHYCERFLQQQGFQTQRQHVGQEGRFNLLAERGCGASTLLCAHLDTVPAAPNWPHDPFALLATGDRLSGLGACDMKGGLAILLELAAAPQLADLALKIALTVDEEAWSAGAWQVIRSEWCQGLKRVFIPEGVIDSQETVIGYGRRGHGVYTLCFRGEPCHAALVGSHAHTAIGQSARFIEQLPEIEARLKSHDLPCQIVVRQLESSTVGLSTPAESRVIFSCFTEPGTTLDAFFEQLTALLAKDFPEAKLSPSARPTPAPEAYALSLDDPELLALAASVQAVSDQVATLAIGLSPADENIYYQALGLPVLSLAPVGSLAHQAGEWVSAQSLEQVFKIYVEFLRSDQC